MAGFLQCLEPGNEPGQPTAEAACAPVDALRLLSYWFREQRATSRRLRLAPDAALLQLAKRAGEEARRRIAQAEQPAAGEVALAISLLGAVSDALSAAGGREALDVAAACLTERGGTLVGDLAMAGAAEELYAGLGDMLELDGATPSDFSALVLGVAQLYAQDAAANLPGASSVGIAPLSQALLLGEMARRGYASISARQAEARAEMAAVATAGAGGGTPLINTQQLSSCALLWYGTDCRVLPVLHHPDLHSMILGVHAAAGMLTALLQTDSGAVPAEALQVSEKTDMSQL